jgi:hypothetical protein
MCAVVELPPDTQSCHDRNEQYERNPYQPVHRRSPIPPPTSTNCTSILALHQDSVATLPRSGQGVWLVVSVAPGIDWISRRIAGSVVRSIATFTTTQAAGSPVDDPTVTTSRTKPYRASMALTRAATKLSVQTIRTTPAAEAPRPRAARARLRLLDRHSRYLEERSADLGGLLLRQWVAYYQVDIGIGGSTWNGSCSWI